MAGVIGIIRSWDIRESAVGLASRELRGNTENVVRNVKRTQRDLSMKFIAIACIATLILIFLFFYLGVIHTITQAVIAFIVVSVYCIFVYDRSC